MENQIVVTIFFLPLKDRPKHYMPLKDFKGEFWHTGIIVKNTEIYECFNDGNWSISGINKLSKDEFKNAVYLKAKINKNKLSAQLRSGTDCAEYVARCLGLSKLKGADKGKYWPQDIYEYLWNKNKNKNI